MIHNLSDHCCEVVNFRVKGINFSSDSYLMAPIFARKMSNWPYNLLYIFFFHLKYLSYRYEGQDNRNMAMVMEIWCYLAHMSVNK